MTARAAFLRALPRHGFAPPAADAAAARFPVGDAAVRSARLVAEYAAGFWALTPDARAVGWDALAAEVVGSAAARLAELRPGLAVPVAAQPDPDAAELAASVRELFTLPAPVRTVRRFAWLEQRAGEFRRWAVAARVLLRTDMPLARLDPRLFDWLAAGTPPGRVEYQTWVDIRDRWRARKRRRRWLQSPPVWVPVLLLFGLSLAVKAVIPPSNPPPARVWGPSERRGFTKDEVRTFLRYDRREWVGPEPYRYSDWVRAGRPKADGAP